MTDTPSEAAVETKPWEIKITTPDGRDITMMADAQAVENAANGTKDYLLETVGGMLEVLLHA